MGSSGGGEACPRDDRRLKLSYIQMTGARERGKTGSKSTSNPPTGSESLSGSTGSPISGPRSNCEPFRQIIQVKLEQGLSAQRIHQDLLADHGFSSGYDSVKRFVRRLREVSQLPFRRMECPPAAEGQVDFGKAAPIIQPNGRYRRSKVLRIVLSFSRKAYSESCFRETTESFIQCLENSFWQLGGVPRTIVIDNLKAAVTKPDWYDPEMMTRQVMMKMLKDEVEYLRRECPGPRR